MLIGKTLCPSSLAETCSCFFKLNVDGSWNNHGVIGAGIIIIDNSGIWIKGFTHHIGVGEVIQAEAWGIFLGRLKLASDLCIRNLVVRGV